MLATPAIPETKALRRQISGGVKLIFLHPLDDILPNCPGFYPYYETIGQAFDTLNQPKASVVAYLAYVAGILCFWSQPMRMG
jgi:hypothetical protein